jgi:hypothetical protein
MPDDHQQWRLLVILDSTLVYRILKAHLSKVYERGFYVYEINGYCANRCRQGDQSAGS